MKTDDISFDVIVAGAGMGGLTAASLLAKSGLRVLVLEKSHVTGGCSSSYKRKQRIFESGATTLIGFDEHQPLRKLEDELGIKIPKKSLDPSMAVHQSGKIITRWRDKKKWLSEVIRHFGEPSEQKLFWNLAFNVSDVVWRVSDKNPFFPPAGPSDWLKLLKNDPRDLWVLPHSLRTVKETAQSLGISNPEFFQFLDEQLIITAQASSDETPFLFGAPAITYTNSTNYYVPGGLIEMVRTLEKYIHSKKGVILTKEGVNTIEKKDGDYRVISTNNNIYHAPVLISNLPIWNLPEHTSGDMADYFKVESAKYQNAWGAFTMGVVTDDPYPGDMPLHHQLHLNGDKIAGLESGSVFISFSMRGDHQRAKTGERVMNVSTHTYPDYWFQLNGDYNRMKDQVQQKLIEIMKKSLPGFHKAEIKLVFSSTPVSWSNWVYRKKGRVGGIPQSMSRSLLDWSPVKTPFEGFFLCGDTVFPGQGIPGVTLSGINVYYRAQKHLKNLTYH
ncbi:MAG: FAD-dependent oxidoreductase [Balneolaceae bacterium]|nr:FAD-dependent oxidoreductase [Balneolaceae bacterium]